MLPGTRPTALVVHPSADRYGSDRQLVESLVALDAAGWRVVLVLPSTGPLVDLVAQAVPAVRVRFDQFIGGAVLRKAVLRPLPFVQLAIRVPVDLVRAVRLVRSVRADALYVNTVTLPLWPAAGRMARRPVVVHVHEAEELSSPLVRRVLYAPLLAADRVIANSATTARVVTTAWRGLVGRVVQIPNGVPDFGGHPYDRAITGRLVLVSRLSPRKGIDVALEALAHLRSAGRDVTLTICGTTFAGYEWFERQLRVRAAQPDLAGSVDFAGFVDPVHEALAEAEVVLVPSLGESFGNAAVEAMLAQRAAVVSDVQGLAEIVDDAETGLLVRPGDAGALADAVGRLLDDPSLRDALARRGRTEAHRRFALDGYRRRIADVMSSVAGRPRTRV